MIWNEASSRGKEGGNKDNCMMKVAVDSMISFSNVWEQDCVHSCREIVSNVTCDRLEHSRWA